MMIAKLLEEMAYEEKDGIDKKRGKMELRK